MQSRAPSRPSSPSAKEYPSAWPQACARLMAATPLWAETGYDLPRCRSHLLHPAARVLAVGDGTEVVGFALVLEHGMGFEPMLVYLCVAEHRRGEGIGTALIERVEQGAARLYLTVTEGNPAVELYRRRGWELVGALPDHDEPGVTELIMRWIAPTA